MAKRKEQKQETPEEIRQRQQDEAKEAEQNERDEALEAQEAESEEIAEATEEYVIDPETRETVQRDDEQDEPVNPRATGVRLPEGGTL